MTDCGYHLYYLSTDSESSLYVCTRNVNIPKFCPFGMLSVLFTQPSGRRSRWVCQTNLKISPSLIRGRTIWSSPLQPLPIPNTDVEGKSQQNGTSKLMMILRAIFWLSDSLFSTKVYNTSLFTIQSCLGLDYSLTGKLAVCTKTRVHWILIFLS